MKHRIDSLALIEGLELFRILPNAAQNRVSSFALLISQRKVHTIWTPLRFMGEDILFHTRKPERAGHTSYTGKQVRLVDRIHGKQPGQRVSGNPSPTRDSVNLLLYRWNNLFGQEPQIVIRTAGTGLIIFEDMWTVPGHHVVVPVQITDGHQCERWTASGLYSRKYLLTFVREGVEVDNRGFQFITLENGYSFAVYCKGVHI